MYDIIRDSTLGQLVRFVLGNRVFRYEDERPGFELPIPKEQVTKKTINSKLPIPVEAIEVGEQVEKLEDGDGSDVNKESCASGDEELGDTRELTVSKTTSRPIHPIRTQDGVVLVDWYAADDPANPMNFSLGKKVYITFIISLYTFAVYIGSSIYTPGELGVMEEFHVGYTPAALGMSLYILGYGIGPLIWSPLSEIPAIGKNPPYVYTFIIFVLMTIPSALTDNFAGLLVLRFLLGFFGSPCLATAASSFQDMFRLTKIVYPMIIWASAATLGPSFGPVVAAFSVQAENWRWSQWEMLWLSAPTLLIMLISLPETSGATILLHRAKRLRKLSGREDLKSQSEIDQANMTFGHVAFDALIKPWEINALDPAVLFSTIYTSLCYGIFYSFFESAPLVFRGMHHFNLGISSLPFLSTVPALLIAAPTYAMYWHVYVERLFSIKGFGPPEDRLKAGLVGSVIIPVGLFLYAWTAKPDIHWIFPTIGLGLNIGGTFLIIQSIFLYLPFTYPTYSASLFAANDLARSTMAAGAILFSRPLFLNLGVGNGVSLLAGLTVVCAGLLGLLYIYGARLRAKSKFAVQG